jgi:hypothetical protein
MQWRAPWRRQRVAAAVRQALVLASDASGVPLMHQARVRLEAELARARRYERPLTVGVVALEPAESGPDRCAAPSALFLAGAIVREALRGSDLVTYDAQHNHYVILFIESTKLQAVQAAKRVQALLSTRTSLRVRHGLAEFPADGLLLEDLITMACSVAATEAL